MNNTYTDASVAYFAVDFKDTYVESRELRGEGRWHHAHKFIKASTNDTYEVWVDSDGAELIVEADTAVKKWLKQGYKH